MSTLIFKPEGVTITRAALEDDVLFNEPLAMNFAYAKDGVLVRSVKDFYDDSDWEILENLKDCPLVMHINETDMQLLKKPAQNWSPVDINNDIVVAGAGPVLTLSAELALKKSDVKTLVDIALGKFTKRVPDFLFEAPGIWMMNSILTARAAVVALAADGRYSIFNEQHGMEYNGLWMFDETLAAARHGKYVYTDEDWKFYCG